MNRVSPSVAAAAAALLAVSAACSPSPEKPEDQTAHDILERRCSLRLLGYQQKEVHERLAALVEILRRTAHPDDYRELCDRLRKSVDGQDVNTPTICQPPLDDAERAALLNIFWAQTALNLAVRQNCPPLDEIKAEPSGEKTGEDAK